MKKILITGGNGLLGQSLTKIILRETGHDLLLTDKTEEPRFLPQPARYRPLDVTNKKNVRDVLLESKPDIIVHTAALTDVDECERDRDEAHRINVMAVDILLEFARVLGAKFVHLSSDYIFEGKQAPADEKTTPKPVNYYGKTKLASENLLRGAGIPYAIVRTMVLYGAGVGIKNNFPLWVLDNLRRNIPIRVVTDQVGQPTYVDDLAYGIVKIVELERTGVYHISGPELISRYDFACRVAELFKLDRTLIQAIRTTDLNQEAPRPLHSEFITQRAQMELGVRMMNIVEGLSAMKLVIEQIARSAM
jgi:dTDP-4-dehydrorhamnose reductase